MSYKDLQSYKDILRTGARDTTGPIQLKAGTVRFEARSKKNSIVHYIFRYSEKLATRKNPSGAAPARVLAQTSDYDVAFKAFLANITGTEKRPQVERVPWEQQLYRAKEKVFWYIFGTTGNSLSGSIESKWWDHFGVEKDEVKRLLKILKYHNIIQKGRDY